MNPPTFPLSIKSVELTTLAHATEEVEKVEEAVRRLFAAEHRSRIVLVREHLAGHFGNPITLIRSRVDDLELINSLLENLASKLSATDKASLLSTLADRLDDSGNLYLRLDKQQALLGKLALREEDPIKVKLVLARKPKPEEVAEALRI